MAEKRTQIEDIIEDAWASEDPDWQGVASRRIVQLMDAAEADAAQLAKAIERTLDYEHTNETMEAALNAHRERVGEEPWHDHRERTDPS